MQQQIRFKGDGGGAFVTDLKELLETARRRDEAWMRHQLYGTPLPTDLFPPPKPLTLRQRLTRWMDNARERLALWVAPWLEPEDPMDD